MSKPRTAQSGLGSVTRNWSDPSVASQPKSSQELLWPPSPPASGVEPSKKLTGSEKRLKDIQDALAGLSSKPKSKPLEESRVINKRATPDSAPSTGILPSKKPRILPPGYKDDPLTKSSFHAPRSPSRSNTPQLPTPMPSSSKSKVATVFLSQEQTQILKLVQEGESVFYTGSAGTGKSVLLREIIKSLRKKYVKNPDAVAITASTGIAACNIGGVTIHSFAGIGLGTESAEELASKIRKNRKAMARWTRTKVLIIDEVSMVDGDLFDKLAKIGSVLRKDLTPFGGIQVIVTGDFFQLPPVTKGSGQVKFAFEAAFWGQTIKRTFNLTKVFRQRDQEFVDMLNEMRFGNLSMASIKRFRELSREIQYDDGLGPTELFPRREDVERSNSTRMTRLQTTQKSYKAQDGGTLQDPIQRDKMLANFMAPKILTLRIDAQVMLIKNVDETLVNGSMGRVLGFVDAASYAVDPDGARSDPGAIVGGNSSATTAAGKAKSSASAQTTLEYPVVEFILPNGGRRTVLVLPETWKVELPNGEVQLSRTQLPLILSWAMSIHKSQGQTLERVKVDLGKVFEKGQAYVALSRATSLDGLQVLNFDPNKVKAHPTVVQWSKTLETIQDKS